MMLACLSVTKLKHVFYHSFFINKYYIYSTELLQNTTPYFKSEYT